MKLRLLSVAFAMLAAPAWAQHQAAPMQAAPMQAAPMQAMEHAAPPMDQAMMNGMTKMNHDMSAAPMTGNADQDFVAMMIPHHQGAIDMAKVELQYGKDPTLRRLARAVIAAQNTEIAEMKTWQAKHAQ